MLGCSPPPRGRWRVVQRGQQECGRRPAWGFFGVAVAALTDDRGEEARRWALFVIRHAAKVAVADAPRTADLRAAKEELLRAGYQWVVVEVEATSFGDGTARRRNSQILLHTRDLSINGLVSELEYKWQLVTCTLYAFLGV